MLQLILHFWGDYILQNNWIAIKKFEQSRVGLVAMLLHVILYSFSFILLTNLNGVILIALTHFIVDWNKIAEKLFELKKDSFLETIYMSSSNNNVRGWVIVILDNILHITINYLIIYYI